MDNHTIIKDIMRIKIIILLVKYVMIKIQKLMGKEHGLKVKQGFKKQVNVKQTVINLVIG